MFKRKFPWLGKLVSDEGFEVAFGHKSVYYIDYRGKFEFGYEDGYLFPTSCFQVAGEAISLSQKERSQMVERIVSGIREDGTTVEVFSAHR